MESILRVRMLAYGELYTHYLYVGGSFDNKLCIKGIDKPREVLN